MNDREYEQLKIFINKLLYETMSIDDYYFIMDRLGAKKKGNRFSAICHEIDSQKYNLSFDTESRCFYCFSGCNCSYSLLSLIKKNRSLQNLNSKTIPCLKWLCVQLNIEFNINDTTQTSNTDRYNWKSSLSKYTKNGKHKLIELPNYDKEILNSFPKLYHQDWLDYGISEETLDKYNIRYYPYKDQIVIPAYTKDGALCGIRIRNMNQDVLDNDVAKYMPLRLLDNTQYNFSTNLCFYGENFNTETIRRKRKVILTESEKTELKFHTWYGNENFNLSLFGSAIGKEQIKFLMELQVEEIIIAIDSDFEEVTFSENGHKTEYEKFVDKVMKIYKQLKPYFSNICVLYNNLGFKGCYKFSPTDYTKEQYEQLWNSRERIIDE